MHVRRWVGVVGIAALLAAGLVLVGGQQAGAAGFTVTNLNDSGGGSLRAAIAAANATSTDDVITFSVNGTISLTSGALVVNKTGGSLTIQGNGVANTVVSQTTADSRVVNVTSTTNLTLIGVTVSVAEAVAPVAALFEVTTPVELEPDIVAVTLTTTVQLLFAGIVPPLKFRLVPLTTAVAVPVRR